jgi:hypothetical protein
MRDTGFLRDGDAKLLLTAEKGIAFDAFRSRGSHDVRCRLRSARQEFTEESGRDA